MLLNKKNLPFVIKELFKEMPAVSLTGNTSLKYNNEQELFFEIEDSEHFFYRFNIVSIEHFINNMPKEHIKRTIKVLKKLYPKQLEKIGVKEQVFIEYPIL